MENTVLSRLRALTNKVRGVQLHQEHQLLPIQEKRTDEIDVLATAINTMFGHVANANRQLSHDSRHDALTGLANRRDLMLTLGQLKEDMQSGKTSSFGLMLLDLNGFKLINDTIGHAAGDIVLQKLAERFRALSTPSLRFFRLGGDEFAVLLLDANQNDVNAALPVIHAAVMAPTYYDGHKLKVSAAVGTALAHPNVPWSSDSLLRAADMAMYDNKRQNQRT